MIATTAVSDDGRIYKRARINIGFMNWNSMTWLS
jgi:hypothetical protein